LTEIWCIKIDSILELFVNQYYMLWY